MNSAFMTRRSLSATVLVSLLGCARGDAEDAIESPTVRFVAAMEAARAGGPGAQSAFINEVVKSREKDALLNATRRMTAADSWLMPLLMAAIDGRMGEFDGKLAARVLWEHFPVDAQAVTEAKLARVSDRTAFALAEQQAHAGKLTPAGKRVLDKHMCAKLEAGRWGVLLTKMKPEYEHDPVDAELNDVSYACEGSPAARGLEPGDTILLIDGERVRGDLVLARFREKNRATVRLRRGGVEHDVLIER